MDSTTGEDLSLFEPLADFYERAGAPLPRIECIDGQQMPQPYRQLLVHDGDMTPTLEAYHGKSIYLQILECRREEQILAREVVLMTEATDQPVEFGAIRINLGSFPDDARKQIEECRHPLGAIIGAFQVEHQSRPTAFFRIESDALMDKAFGLGRCSWLYGRCNVISDGNGRVLAQVVEILPLLEDQSAQEGSDG